MKLTEHPYVLELKHHQTPEEIIFFKALTRVLDREFPEFRHCVAKQVPIAHDKGFFILDFYIGVLKLAFEIDGGYHWQTYQVDKDLRRDEILNRDKHIRVYHFPNAAIKKRSKKLAGKLADIINHRIQTRVWVKRFHEPPPVVAMPTEED